MAQYTVYVIRSSVNGFLYKGLTSDIKNRLFEHNSGKNFSTKPYIPWELVYSKDFSDRNEARIHEKYLKSGIGRDFLKKYLSENDL